MNQWVITSSSTKSLKKNEIFVPWVSNLSARWNKQKESNKIELPETANDLEWCPTTTSQNDSNMFISMGDLQ